MSMQNDRILFQMIADPIMNYFKENGFDPIQSLPMVTDIAERVHTNLRSHIEIAPKKEEKEE